MSDITLFHNPRCSKSRQALQLLRDHGIEPDLVLYLETPPSAEELRKMWEKLSMSPRQLLRRGEEAYKQAGLSDTGLTDDTLIEAMIAAPKLIERPIAVRGQRAVVGRPPENVLDLLS